MRELGVNVVCRACFCTFYTSEMNTHSYIPFLFSINFLCHLYLLDIHLCVVKILFWAWIIRYMLFCTPCKCVSNNPRLVPKQNFYNT